MSAAIFVHFLLRRRCPADLSLPVLQPNFLWIQNFMQACYLFFHCKFSNLTFRQVFLPSMIQIQGRSSDFASSGFIVEKEWGEVGFVSSTAIDN